ESAEYGLACAGLSSWLPPDAAHARCKGRSGTSSKTPKKAGLTAREHVEYLDLALSSEGASAPGEPVRILPRQVGAHHGRIVRNRRRARLAIGPGGRETDARGAADRAPRRTRAANRRERETGAARDGL